MEAYPVSGRRHTNSLFIVEPIVQIEIDEGRNTLYARSSKGSIQVFDLGADGQSSSFIADLSSSTITTTAAQILK